jgi:hypothetical protein
MFLPANDMMWLIDFLVVDAGDGLLMWCWWLMIKNNASALGFIALKHRGIVPPMRSPRAGVSRARALPKVAFWAKAPLEVQAVFVLHLHFVASLASWTSPAL